jgi:hypothetical protein
MRKTISAAAILITLVGCRARLNDERTVAVDPGTTQYITVDPIAREQTVKVAATSANGQFNIYFFLEKDKTTVEKEAMTGKLGPKVLDKALKTAKADLSATIPANERATVMLTGDGPKADVKLKITN